MPMTPDQIRHEALSLKPRDLSALIQCLLDSFESDAAETIGREWIEAAQRRLQEITSGDVTGIPADEVFARVRNRNVQT